MMQRSFRALLVLAVLLAVALVEPTVAQCKTKTGSNGAATAAAVPALAAELAPVHAANATETEAATVNSEVGSDANYGPAADVSSSSNKIQNAPKKRMKNKILFDVTKPVKSSATSSTSSTNNNSPSTSSGVASQQS